MLRFIGGKEKQRGMEDEPLPAVCFWQQVPQFCCCVFSLSAPFCGAKSCADLCCRNHRAAIALAQYEGHAILE